MRAIQQLCYYTVLHACTRTLLLDKKNYFLLQNEVGKIHLALLSTIPENSAKKVLQGFSAPRK